MLIVFGSINLDMVIKVPSFPKAGETVLTDYYRMFYGGKGANQAVAAHHAGVTKTIMVGMVGTDDFGERATYNLRRQGVITSGIARTEDAPTGFAAIMVRKDGENSVLVTPGANMKAMADQIPDEILKPDTVIMMQGEVDTEQNQLLIERAHKKSCRTIMNCAPAHKIPEKTLKLIDYLIVNEHEANFIAEALKIKAKKAELVAKAIAAQTNSHVIITQSHKGAVGAEPNGALWRIGALKVDAVDTTGAGDAYCGVFAASLKMGYGFTASMMRASVGGSLACTKMGAQSALPIEADIDKHLDLIDKPIAL